MDASFANGCILLINLVNVDIDHIDILLLDIVVNQFFGIFDILLLDSPPTLNFLSLF